MLTVGCAELATELDDLTISAIVLVEGEDGFDSEEVEILLKSIAQPAEPAILLVHAGWIGIDVDDAAFDLGLVDLNVVGEEIEGAAALKIEAGVMPVAGENAIADGATIERESHMWTAVVDGVGPTIADKDDDAVATTRDNSGTLDGIEGADFDV